MIATSGRRVRLVTVAVGVAGILVATAPAAAQDISSDSAATMRGWSLVAGSLIQSYGA